jgi:hypothetical protein
MVVALSGCLYKSAASGYSHHIVRSHVHVSVTVMLMAMSLINSTPIGRLHGSDNSPLCERSHVACQRYAYAHAPMSLINST